MKYGKRADIFDRIEINSTNNCFITLKDHKENFVNHPITRLINPAKNEIGRISKLILNKINISLCEKLKLKRNTYPHSQYLTSRTFTRQKKLD